MPLGEFLELLSAGGAAPGGGAAAALAVALGASLCAMAARLSANQLQAAAGPAQQANTAAPSTPATPRPAAELTHTNPAQQAQPAPPSTPTTPRPAAELADYAERLRDKVAQLCQADAQAYGRVIDALRMPAEQDATHRRQAVAEALSGAASVPMRVVETAAEVARLAARLASEGNPNLRGDAVTAALLAESGARAAATLVRLNLADAPEDHRLERVDQVLREVAHATAQAQQI